MSWNFAAAALVLEAALLAAVLAMFTRVLLRAAAAVRRQAELETARPAIREALLHYITGSAEVSRLREFAASQRGALAECLLDFRGAVSGGAGERLWDLALELALVHDWCAGTHSREPRERAAAFERLALACAYEPCRRVAGELQGRALGDPILEVRVAAARGLARSDDPKDAERVFQLAVSENLLARVMVSEALRPHAVALCGEAVPEVLRGGDEARVLAALEMVIAWGRAVPLFELYRLIESGSPAARLAALRALPLVPDTPENHEAVARAIADPDPAVSREATDAAGRLRSYAAVTALERCVAWGSPEMARAAAESLAAIGEPAPGARPGSGVAR